MNKILVIDDELSIRESFSLILEGKFKVVTAASGEGGLKLAADQKIDLAYLDMRMPGLDGLETLQRLKEIDPSIEVIMVTAVNDVQKASEAIKLGARDYVIKPFDVAAILKMTELVLRRKGLIREGEKIQQKPVRLLGQHEKIITLNKAIIKIAGKETPVLLWGERGTEAESVAQAVHELSAQSNAPLLKLELNPSQTPAEIKKLLCGQAGGESVSVLEKNSGLLENCHGGTIFLNHLEYCPLEILNIITAANAHLIAASSAADLVENFRDLYDFFSGNVIMLPPLRERLSDLPILAQEYLAALAEKYGKEIKPLSAEILEIFSNYNWPGNQTELALLLERLILTVATEEISKVDLPLDILLQTSGAFGSDYFTIYEKAQIQKIFELAGGDREKAATILKVNPLYLADKLSAEIR